MSDSTKATAPHTHARLEAHADPRADGEARSRPAPRTIEKEITIRADVRSVWDALTRADELVRWFPLEASTDPRPGGSIRLSWGKGGCGDTWAIETFDPPRHLRVTDRPAGPDRDAGPAPDADPAPDAGRALNAPDAPGAAGEDASAFSIDYRLESAGGGRTRLRLVHHGFAGSKWDHLFDGTSRGWDFELGGLRHYLERHAGTPRRVVRIGRRSGLALEEAWGRLFGSRGVALLGEAGGTDSGTSIGVEDGDGLDLEAPDGTKLRAEVARWLPPRDFAAVLPEWNDAYLRVRVDRAYDGTDDTDADLWISTYGLGDADVRRLAAALEATHARAFADLDATDAAGTSEAPRATIHGT